MKANSIPRLELLGNIFLSRLMMSVKNALSKILTILDCFYWTDSEVTISKIKAMGKVFKIFVENRLGETREKADASKLFCFK